MQQKIKTKGGGIEYKFSKEELDLKKIFKKTKKAVKLTDEEKEKILYVICKKLNLI